MHGVEIRHSKNWILSVSLVLIVLFLWSGKGNAQSQYLPLFTGKYPAATALNTCLVCHQATATGGRSNNRNGYGSAWSNAGGDTAAFGTIEGDDSDGDGFTNLAEITAVPSTFPGDANSFPAAAANRPPVLGAIGNKSGPPGSAITFTATATDPDAGQTRTFSLTGAPAGATINSSTGAFSWTPASAGTFPVTVVVADNGTPSLNDSEAITITVAAAANRPPVLGAIGNKSGPPGSAITFTATATDPDAGQTRTFSLDGCSRGSDDQQSTGAFSWTPASAGTFPVTVVVADNGTPSLNDSEAITITVSGGGQPPPVLAAIGNKSGPRERDNVHGDRDRPRLRVRPAPSRSTGAPAGATINSSTGAFSWTPASAGTGSYPVTVVVADNGTPSLNDSEAITITVAAAATDLRFWLRSATSRARREAR